MTLTDPPPGGVRVRYPLGGSGSGTPPGGVPCPGRVPATLPGGGGPTSVVSKLQLSSSAVSWPYIALCPMELWVMLQSIMGVKKKKKKKFWDGYPPPVDRQIDGWTDTCQNITFPSYYVTRAVIMDTAIWKVYLVTTLYARMIYFLFF